MPSFRLVATLSAIVLVGLLARVGWTLWTAPEIPPLSDPQFYHAAAVSIADGQGYSVDFSEAGIEPGGDGTAFWPPGYSAYLAAFYVPFGDSLSVARTANILAGVLTIIPIYFIGRRLFGREAALLGAGVAALLPSLVFWTPVILTETLFTLVFALTLAVIVYVPTSDGKPRLWQVGLIAVLIAASAMVRGQAFLLIPTAALWWMISQVRISQVFVKTSFLGLLVLLLLLPWSMRNLITMDSSVLLSANVGYNLRVGHATYSTGGYSLPQDLWNEGQGLSFHDRESFFNSLGRERAIDFALENPQAEIGLAIDKAVWLWRPDSDALRWVSSFGRTPLTRSTWEPLRTLHDGSYLLVLAMAGVGIVLLRSRWRGATLVMGLVVLWTLLHVVFFGSPRYHVPVLAAIVPLAAAGFLELLRPATSPAARSCAGGGIIRDS